MAKYPGVQTKPGAKRTRRFEAYIKVRSKKISLGCFKYEGNAAWAADYARYLLWGVDVKRWPATTGLPNFFPARNPGGSPEVIETIVFRHGLVSRDKFMSHQAEYLRDAGPGRQKPAA